MENASQTLDVNDNNLSNAKHLEPVPQNKEKTYHACGSEKHEIKDCESKRNIYIIDLKRNQIIEHNLRKELEKHREVKSMRVRQDNGLLSNRRTSKTSNKDAKQNKIYSK